MLSHEGLIRREKSNRRKKSRKQCKKREASDILAVLRVLQNQHDSPVAASTFHDTGKFRPGGSQSDGGAQFDVLRNLGSLQRCERNFRSHCGKRDLYKRGGNLILCSLFFIAPFRSKFSTQISYLLAKFSDHAMHFEFSRSSSTTPFT